MLPFLFLEDYIFVFLAVNIKLIILTAVNYLGLSKDCVIKFTGRVAMSAEKLPRARPGPLKILGVWLLGAAALAPVSNSAAAVYIPYGWGCGNSGQLGDNSVENRFSPVQTPAMTTLSDAATGDSHSVFAKSDGTVWATGHNNAGQLGNGANTDRLTPVQTLGPGGSGYLTGVTQVSAGESSSAALKNDGTVWTWGYNNHGQAGVGTANINHSTPVQVLGPGGSGYLTDVSRISSGCEYVTALKNDGTVWAWGRNGYGQLGNGSTSDCLTPAQTLKGASESATDFLTGVTQISAGRGHTLALKSDGTVWAWGDNYYGQLGVNSFTNSATPVQVLGVGGFDYLRDIIHVSAGHNHSLALKNDGTVWAWGDNYYGQLGNNSTSTWTTPVQVWGDGGEGYLGSVSKIGAGRDFSLALKSDGTVRAWGYNHYGELGNGGTAERHVPVQTSVLTNIPAVFSGSSASHSFAGALSVLPVNLTMAVSPAGAGVTIPVIGTGKVTPNQAFNISATPAAGYIFMIWSVSGGASVTAPSSASTSATLNADGTITANFSQTPTVYLTMASAPSSGGVTVPVSGVSQMNRNESFAISATAASGYAFVVWSVTGGASVTAPSSASTSAVLSADGTITANFSQAPTVTLTMAVSPAGAGTTTPAAGAGPVIPNQAVSISATAAVNFKFSQWTVSAGASVASASSASTTATLTASAAVTANFISTAYGDYNGDGKSDIVFRNSTTSQGIMYLMSGLTMSSWGAYADAGTTYRAVASGDFNNDGCADLLMRSSAGAVQIWLMSGASTLSKTTIYDGSDPNWRVIGTGDFDGDGKCDILWQNESTAQAVIYLMNGTGIKSYGVIYDGASAAFRAAGTGDFAGNGKCGIVWQNSSTGAVTVWLMNGLSVASTGVIYDGSDRNWVVVGTGDFNGDGKCDIAWRNSSTTAVLFYFMNGVTVSSWGTVYDGSLGNDWRFAGAADYNGDGKCDMLLQNVSTGNVTGYLLNGTTVLSSGSVYSGGDPAWVVAGFGDIHNSSLTMAVSGSGTTAPAPGTSTVITGAPQAVTATAAAGYKFKNWTLSGSAWLSSATSSSATLVSFAPSVTLTANFQKNPAPFDFNADGKSDLLWRNSSNGYVAMWLMSGAQASQAGIIFDSDSTWVPKGKGDFNGDGKCDIIWRRSTTGAVALWFMNGLTTIGSGYLCDSSDRSVAGVGDFNGDGYADILWRGSDGAVYMSLMNGVSVISSGKIFEAGTTWAPCGTGDYNGDGKCDILWRDTSNGNVAMWLMNGLTMSSGQIIFIGAGGWTPMSCGDYNGDGKCDIAWQNSSGNAAVWLQNGFTTLSSGYIYTGGDTSWVIADSGDYDGDGCCDITWRNSGSGQALIYFMNGVTVKGWTVIFAGDPNWSIIK
jgi:alpha-tubulin suppressor-like RCC1 family protein